MGTRMRMIFGTGMGKEKHSPTSPRPVVIPIQPFSHHNLWGVASSRCRRERPRERPHSPCAAMLQAMLVHTVTAQPLLESI
ncbi:hypothetical protein TIFTF001_009253, partial [Ficus carica]